MTAGGFVEGVRHGDMVSLIENQVLVQSLAGPVRLVLLHGHGARSLGHGAEERIFAIFPCVIAEQAGSGIDHLDGIG